MLLQILKKKESRSLDSGRCHENRSVLGEISLASEPVIKQILVGADLLQDQLERKLYIIRKRVENDIRKSNIKQKAFSISPVCPRRYLYIKVC